MSCCIKRNHTEKTIDLHVEGDFFACFDDTKYDFTDAQLRLISFMCQKAVRAGKDLKAKQIRKAIGA